MTGRFRPPVRTVIGEKPSPAGVVDFLGAREHVDVIIPRTNIAGKMRLVSRKEEFEVDAETRTFLADNGFPIDGSAHASPYAKATWDYERATRILAVAIRDPQDTGRALATADDYRDLDDDQIDSLAARYSDLKGRLNPIEAGELEPGEVETIVLAAKKKDVETLMAFGSSKLARYAITSVAPPAS